MKFINESLSIFNDDIQVLIPVGSFRHCVSVLKGDAINLARQVEKRHVGDEGEHQNISEQCLLLQRLEAEPMCFKVFLVSKSNPNAFYVVVCMISPI